jgi:hypothetical protein
MKILTLLAAGFLSGAVLVAANPAQTEDVAAKDIVDWTLFWSGSWEESASINLGGTLYNRAGIKLNFIPPGLALRAEFLGRNVINFELDPPWTTPGKDVANYNGGLYHKDTGSRLLLGVLDEWGLPARIRNPWIRSPPYAENRKPVIADLKTAASSTKEDEAYLYLSSPFLELPRNIRLRGFASAQTEFEQFTPAISGGLDFVFSGKTGLMLETFSTWGTLPPSKTSTWFSDPPPLPERDFGLFAAGLVFYNPLVSLSADWAFSETFAWGTDIYANMGVCFTPSLPFSGKSRPLSVSFAVDGAGERFVYRDGANHGSGFRNAAKVEWKGKRNSLFRASTVLRGPEAGGDFNRSSTSLSYRFPAANKNSPPVRLTRVSFAMDRNAENPAKINEGYSANMGISIKLPQSLTNSPLGLNFHGTYKELAVSTESPPPYPVFGETRSFNTASGACEFTWSPRIFQFRAKFGYSAYEGKDDKFEVSFGAAARFKYGRLGFKAVSADFPEKWTCSVSWRLENR